MRPGACPLKGQRAKLSGSVTCSNTCPVYGTAVGSPGEDQRPPRIKIDLRRLPASYRYPIAIVVVAIVVALALMFRRPVPGWFQGVIPILGWIGVVALLYLAVRWVWRRR